MHRKVDTQLLLNKIYSQLNDFRRDLSALQAKAEKLAPLNADEREIIDTEIKATEISYAYSIATYIADCFAANEQELSDLIDSIEQVLEVRTLSH